MVLVLGHPNFPSHTATNASKTDALNHPQMAIASAPLSEAPFLVGTAISVWQNSGGEPTNWATWAAKHNILGMSTIKGGDKVLRRSCCSQPLQVCAMRCYPGLQPAGMHDLTMNAALELCSKLQKA